MRKLFIILAIVLSFNSEAVEPARADAQSQYDNLLAYYFAAARTGDEQVIEQFVTAGIPIDSFNNKASSDELTRNAQSHPRSSADVTLMVLVR